MLILVINSGSSSVKYNLFDIDMRKMGTVPKGTVPIFPASRCICKGTIERIGTRKHPTRHEAIKIVKDIITQKAAGKLSGIGHRVVHGGEIFKESVLINKKVLATVTKLSELAPLHNPPSLEGIEACMKLFPGIPEVAVFDTAFHQTMPPYAYHYGIPYKFYKKYGIRKYGFHGTSHRFVAQEAARLLNRPIKNLNLITVHLGNGCSITSIKGGKVIDTSMGFTPLEGLIMGTRSGDLDPAIISFLIQHERLDTSKINDILNKESGLVGISGVSNDMRDILKACRKGNKRAALAYDMFVYRIKKYIGAYSAALGEVDAVIFTAGIGENVPKIKNELKKELMPLLGNKAKFLIIPTNEELLIALDTYKLIGNK